jgi:hypothetical protein
MEQDLGVMVEGGQGGEGEDGAARRGRGGGAGAGAGGGGGSGSTGIKRITLEDKSITWESELVYLLSLEKERNPRVIVAGTP